MSLTGNPMGGGRSSLFGDEGSDEVVSVDLNMTPLMDVLSNILFFLMASFGAAILGFMAASVPVQAEADTEQTEAPRTDRVTTNIQIRLDGFRVNCSHDSVDPTKLEAFKLTIPKKDGAYDLEALREHAYKIKQEFPASDTAVLVPNDKTIYEEITNVMEAVKFKRVDLKKLRLLPKIVVADIVRGDVEEKK